MPSGEPSRHLRIVGHRGGCRRALENTSPAFSIALDEGADGLGTDVRRLADGTIVLVHDDEIAAVACSEL